MSLSDEQRKKIEEALQKKREALLETKKTIAAMRKDLTFLVSALHRSFFDGSIGSYKVIEEYIGCLESILSGSIDLEEEKEAQAELAEIEKKYFNMFERKKWLERKLFVINTTRSLAHLDKS